MTTDADITAAAKYRYGDVPVVVFTYVDKSAKYHEFGDGGGCWRLGDRERWFVLSINSEIVARRRTKAELLAKVSA